MAGKIVVCILLIIYLVLNLVICSAYATNQVISDNIDGIDDEKYPGVKALIKQMQADHPNWKFKILYTKLNFDDVINGESTHTRSLIPNNYSTGGEFICEECGDTLYEGGGWKCASKTAIRYLMDPRNFLNEQNVFQFLNMEYNDSCSIENVKKMVSGSFLDNDSYINTLMNSGKEYNLSPYYLVARIIQEQGTSGTTVLSSGKEYTGKSGTTYSGLYNLYNIEATGSDIIENGLKKAQKEGWTSIEASISGGAKWIKNNYASIGQTSLYLQKFDVEDGSNGLYWHQYMQNLMAAQSEGSSFRRILEQTNAIDNEYTFLIPVYENMPKLQDMDLVKINANPSLQLREGPSASSNRIGSCAENSVIIRIKKAESKASDGYYWDMVILKNGLIGYMAREPIDGSKTYLISVKDLKMTYEENTSEPEQQKESEQPTESESQKGSEQQKESESNDTFNEARTAKFNSATNVITLVPNITIQDVSSLIGEITSIKDKDGNTVNVSEKARTGLIVNDTYTIVVLGDVNGDGEVDAIDLLLIKRYILGTYTSEEKGKASMDINSDGIIDAIDLLLQKRQLLGSRKITL